jgi:hypothetical protein
MIIWIFFLQNLPKEFWIWFRSFPISEFYQNKVKKYVKYASERVISTKFGTKQIGIYWKNVKKMREKNIKT